MKVTVGIRLCMLQRRSVSLRSFGLYPVVTDDPGYFLFMYFFAKVLWL
jgi:hypothetical protein